MAAAVASPRYSVEDFETMSVRSAAPSYRSDAPSYHSTEYRNEPTPAYTPRSAAGGGSSSLVGGSLSGSSSSGQQSRSEPSSLLRPRQSHHQQTIGLPPLPPLASGMGTLNIHNYRVPMWSTRNAPAERQYNSVIERRAKAEKERQKAARKGGAGLGAGVLSGRSRAVTLERAQLEYSSSSTSVHRPLEDPYLVGEQAAAQARRERLSRETGEDILIREDQQWDWLLVQMRDQDARERDWPRFRRDVDTGHRRTLFRRMGDRMI